MRSARGWSAFPARLHRWSRCATSSPTAARRLSTGSGELDRVLGGGLVAGSVVLVGGEPGVGKSSLLLQALGAIAAAGGKALLVSGEESPAQVRLRAERLGVVDGISILAETELETVCEVIRREKPDVCVVDSVQTLFSSELSSRRPVASPRCERRPTGWPGSPSARA